MDWSVGWSGYQKSSVLLDRDFHRDVHRGALGRAPTQHETLIARKAEFIRAATNPSMPPDGEGFVDAVVDRGAPEIARNPSERLGRGIGEDDIVGIRLPVIAIQNAYHGRHSCFPRGMAVPNSCPYLSPNSHNTCAEG